MKTSVTKWYHAASCNYAEFLDTLFTITFSGLLSNGVSEISWHCHDIPSGLHWHLFEKCQANPWLDIATRLPGMTSNFRILRLQRISILTARFLTTWYKCLIRFSTCVCVLVYTTVCIMFQPLCRPSNSPGKCQEICSTKWVVMPNVRLSVCSAQFQPWTLWISMDLWSPELSRGQRVSVNWV